MSMLRHSFLIKGVAWDFSKGGSIGEAYMARHDGIDQCDDQAKDTAMEGSV
jgi:hypothetical protein